MKAKVRRMGCMAWNVLVFMILASSPAVGAEFTAEIVITGPGEGYTYSLHVKDPMYRIQKIQGPMNVPPFPSIVNRDTGMTWGLMPTMRQYVEMPDLEKTFLANPLVGWAMTRKGMTETPGADETLNGYTCETRVYTVAGESKPAAKVWVAKKLGHVVREERFGANENPVLELRNIQEGPVDAAMFEVPEGFTRVSMEGGQGKSAPSDSAGPAPGGASSPSSKPAGASAGHIVFILDASGSMWGQVDGTPKIAIAKEVLTDLVQDLPDESVVGLVAYGHRRKGDCSDVEELIPLGRLDKERVIKTVQGLSPKGKTPITLSVRKTVDRIRHVEEETTIILVSDGKETCGGDPCALVKELKDAGIRFTLHVVGFDVTEEERIQLECMAKAGGGVYYTAKTAHEFRAAAREVVRKTQEQGFLRLTALRGDKPFRAAVEVRAAGADQVIKSGRTGTDPKRRGAPVKPGVYDLRFSDTELPDSPEVWIRGVEVAAGETVERVAVFREDGVLSVKAVKDNAPMKAYVKVHRQEDEKYMKDGYTRQDGK
ncbi:MAG: VWA domain-containing protein, partial [Desulfobacteraceae bacterium]